MFYKVSIDLNSIARKTGLYLNIADTGNALNYQLVFYVKEFFRLSKTQATQIYDKVLSSVKQCQAVAQKLGLVELSKR